MAETRGGGRSDMSTLNTRDPTLKNIIIHSTLLVHEISIGITVVLECQMYIVVDSFDGCLTAWTFNP